MKLTPPSFLILGMVRLGVRSGYAIKKATDASTRFFWPTSLAQVYPQLGQLERAGLVSRHEAGRGARKRSSYELTDEGQAALLAWLNSPREGATQFRDEGLLRLFFADALTAPEQLELVRRLRRRAARAGVYMREQIVPLAQTLEAGGTRYPALVARLGADTYAYVEQWLAQQQAQLEGAPSARDTQRAGAEQ